ncbi:ribonucleoside reductase class II [Mycobacterium phage Phlei]|uniref:Uncharacterized protein n=1 Tax=Mycobacterium phage Phlei TaxID=1690684 RepID=A0A0N9BDR0_9CAUD|nr:ribonucleoside reductase class II [Mycobacterium phage Phlei]ALA48152.1 hypothetical protein [Mycobacterium phage Phlei]
MTAKDPFVNAPTDDEIENAPDEAQSVWDTSDKSDRPVVIQSEGKVVVTLKGGAGYDAPWIVVHADSVDDAYHQVNSNMMLELMRVTQLAGADFAGKAPTKPAAQQGVVQPQQSRAPQAAQQAPGGEKRYCQHGEMKFISGFSKKNGKPYKMFACPVEDRNQQCDPQWLRNN